MLGLVCAMVFLTRITSVAGGREDPCSDLTVQLTTSFTRTNAGDNIVSRIRFDAFADGATEIANHVTWDGAELTADLRLEQKIWAAQKSIAKSVASKLGLGAVYLLLEYLFRLSRKTQSVFLKVDRDVFVVSENGTLRYCGSTVDNDGRIKRLVLECAACRTLSTIPSYVDELTRWVEVCRGASDGERVRPFESMCPDEFESVTTIRWRNAVRSTAAVTETSTIDVGTVETITDTNLIVASVVCAVAILAVAIVFFEFRGRLRRCWGRCLGRFE